MTIFYTEINFWSFFPWVKRVKKNANPLFKSKFHCIESNFLNGCEMKQEIRLESFYSSVKKRYNQNIIFFSRGKHPGTYFEFSEIQISSAIVPPQNKLTMVYGYDIPYGASRCTYKRKTFQRFGPQKKTKSPRITFLLFLRWKIMSGQDGLIVSFQVCMLFLLLKRI